MVLWQLQPVMWTGIALANQWARAMPTTNNQTSFGMIRFFLNRAGPKVHSSEGSTRLAANCTHALVWHLRNKPAGLSARHTPRPHFQIQCHFSLFVCLFVWNQRRYRATFPSPLPPTLAPNYLPNVGVSRSSLTNLCGHEQWAHRKAMPAL